MIPDELTLEIYKHCDVSTRINVNTALHWNYKRVNPYFDHKFLPSPQIKKAGSILCGNTWIDYYNRIVGGQQCHTFGMINGNVVSHEDIDKIFSHERPACSMPRTPFPPSNTVKSQRKRENKERNKKNKLLYAARNLR